MNVLRESGDAFDHITSMKCALWLAWLRSSMLHALPMVDAIGWVACLAMCH